MTHSGPRRDQGKKTSDLCKLMVGSSLVSIGISSFRNLVPRVLSLPPSRKYPGFGWSRGTQNLGANKNVLQERTFLAKCKIVTSVRMVESTGGDVSFFRNICGDKNSFYRQVFLHYIRTFDIEAVHVIFDSEKHVYKSLNFKTLSRHSQRKPARVTT